MNLHLYFVSILQYDTLQVESILSINTPVAPFTNIGNINSNMDKYLHAQLRVV